uniref:RNase H type-1 domain-containing protein n=1 Tax=Cannabis sativa TaxID=3483 RepID=A0A803P425_CANSA
MVAYLITPQRQWDHTTLLSNFCQVDIDRICTIPLNLFPSDDILIWHHSSTDYRKAKTNSATTSNVVQSQPNQLLTQPSIKAPRISSKPKWLAPSSGRLKLNTDATFDAARGRIGIGVILQNSAGNIVASFIKPISNNFKSEEMEALAIVHSLQWLLQSNLDVHFVKMDSLIVVKGLQQTVEYHSAFHAILNDIRLFVPNFPRVLMSHVYRTANTEAHMLAKFALTVDVDCSY